MTYIESVSLPTETFERINKLLALPYFDEMTNDEMKDAGAEDGAYEGIFGVKFEDGTSFSYDLCSGSSNYYDNMVFYDKEGYESVFDCDYELGKTIEFDHNGNFYVINIVLEPEVAK